MKYSMAQSTTDTFTMEEEKEWSSYITERDELSKQNTEIRRKHFSILLKDLVKWAKDNEDHPPAYGDFIEDCGESGDHFVPA